MLLLLPFFHVIAALAVLCHVAGVLIVRWLFFAAGPLEAAVGNESCGFRPTIEQTRRLGYGSLGCPACDGRHGGRLLRGGIACRARIATS